MKKISYIFFFFVLTIIFFHNFFLHKLIDFNLEKITEKKVEIENISINLKNQKLTINNINILNNQNFEYKNIFYCSEITINFNFLNLFKEIIFFDEIVFKYPTIYLEVKKKDLIFEDNISVLEKKKDSYKPKIYPKKTKDRNIIFKRVKILEPKVNINISEFYKYENLKLSNINFVNVGTSTKKSLHFKKVFKIILTDIYLRVPNFEMRKKIKDIYMSE